MIKETMVQSSVKSKEWDDKTLKWYHRWLRRLSDDEDEPGVTGGMAKEHTAIVEEKERRRDRK